MRPAPSPSAPPGRPVPLAAAFLALGDPGVAPARPRRSPAAAATALVLAFAPLLVSGAGALLGTWDERAAATLPAKTWPADADEDDAAPGAG